MSHVTGTSFGFAHFFNCILIQTKKHFVYFKQSNLNFNCSSELLFTWSDWHTPHTLWYTHSILTLYGHVIHGILFIQHNSVLFEAYIYFTFDHILIFSPFLFLWVFYPQLNFILTFIGVFTSIIFCRSYINRCILTVYTLTFCSTSFHLHIYYMQDKVNDY